MSASTRPLHVEPHRSARSSAFIRRRALPALALPRGREDRRTGALLSLMFHVLLIVLLLTPLAMRNEIIERDQGAGGLGPAGGGSGHDGTNGSGPGSGGGVGSGIGTGRGSGVGPGTGGGIQENYPPTPTELFMPPFPMPDRVRGFHLVAEYNIDESGRILSVDFTHTKDRDYNKRLEEVLKSFRFRPGTRPDGTPIRMKAQIIYDF